MNLIEWGARWGIPMQALQELEIGFGMHGTADVPENGKSEAWAQSVVMLEAARKGVKLWRNNVGALKDEGGRLVRYGLANAIKGENSLIKSGDLIGIRKVLVQQSHVGQYLGVFVSREMKEPGWQFDPTNEREVAQLRWAQLIVSMGGDARFATGEGTL